MMSKDFFFLEFEHLRKLHPEIIEHRKEEYKDALKKLGLDKIDINRGYCECPYDSRPWSNYCTKMNIPYGPRKVCKFCIENRKNE